MGKISYKTKLVVTCVGLVSCLCTLQPLFEAQSFKLSTQVFFSRNSWYNTFEKGFRHNPWKRETPPLKKGTTTLEKGEPPFHNSSTLRQGYPWKRDTLEKGMMPSREPAGLDNALEEEKDEEMEDVEDEPLEKGEEEWRPGMKLRKNHPSWMWKQNRKDLASKEGRNKAGKKRGGGTTRTATLGKGMKTGAQTLGKGMKAGGPTLGKGMKAGGPTLAKGLVGALLGKGWWLVGALLGKGALCCEREERARSSGFRRRRRRRRKTRRSPTRSQSPCSDQRSEGSVTASPRSAASKKEVESSGLAEIPEEDDKPFTKMLEELKLKEAAPLEKGTGSADTKTEPLEKGTGAAKTEPLEKGTGAAKTEPLEKGQESVASSAAAPPLEKGKVLVDYYGVLFVDNTIPASSLLIMTQVSWSLFFVNVWSGQSGNWVCNGV